jgi:hypothetical protein
MLARLEGGLRDEGMGVVRGTDIDQVDIVACDDVLPTRGILFPTELRRCRRDLGLTPPHQHLHHRLDRQIEKFAHLTVGVTVRFAHKLIADQGHIDFLLRHISISHQNSVR